VDKPQYAGSERDTEIIGLDLMIMAYRYRSRSQPRVVIRPGSLGFSSIKTTCGLVENLVSVLVLHSLSGASRNECELSK
jgi:hypothetical protein